MADYLAHLFLYAILTWPPVAGGLWGLIAGVLAFGNPGAVFGLLLGVAGGVLLRQRQLRERDVQRRDGEANVSILARGRRHSRSS